VCALEPTTTADKQASNEAAWTRHWEALRLVHNLQAWIWHRWNPEESGRMWMNKNGRWSFIQKKESHDVAQTAGLETELNQASTRPGSTGSGPVC
jgi:hypothetical protein